MPTNFNYGTTLTHMSISTTNSRSVYGISDWGFKVVGRFYCLEIIG